MNYIADFYNKYDIVNVINENGTDEYTTRVYKVRNKQTGEQSIAKYTTVYDNDDMGQRRLKFSGLNTLVNQLKQEPRALMMLKDVRGVIDLLDYYEEFTSCIEMILVMEEAAGISLKDYIEQQGTFTARCFYSFMYHLISIVSAMHQKGIIHRDLSYNNIFIDINSDTGDIKGIHLIDFGLVYIKGFGIRHKLAMTPGFAPPESVRHVIKRVEPMYDLYSVGVIMYYVLNKRFPYPDYIMNNRTDENNYIEFDCEGISIEVKQFIRKCLRYNSIDRPRSIAEIKTAVYKGLEREGISIAANGN
ncbi:MAG TPA: serine/threonine-protein kinase [Clostridiales bacterium]|nr:serine/threonine-protein kinase [Clostridiales bacterium]